MKKIDVLAEVTGSVWKIMSTAGDSVTAGDVLIILESMKMEIPVNVEAAGTVVEILVGEGDAVVEGQILATLDVH